MNERWTQAILYIAGGWNVLAGASALANPGGHFRLYSGALNLSEPVSAFFFRAVWINVIAWGVAYVLAAWQTLARAPVLLAGALGKLAYFGASLLLYLNAGSGATLLAFASLDLAFAALFIWIVASSRPQAG